MLTTGDSQSLWADPFVTMAVAAQRTTPARASGVTVSNPMTRHPAVVASALVALQQISGGRIVFGVQLRRQRPAQHRRARRRSVAEIGEFGRAVKALCAGETVAWQGTTLVLRWGRHPTPMWMAAEGPRTQFLAGQIADGVVLSNALDAEVLALARAEHRRRRRGGRRGRSTTSRSGAWRRCARRRPRPRASTKLRFLLAGTANHVYRFHIEGKGAARTSCATAIAELQRRYDSTAHATPGPRRATTPRSSRSWASSTSSPAGR